MTMRAVDRLRRNEEGVALITVLMVTIAALILVSGITAYAVGSQDLSRRDQDWSGALAAAEAGVDEYLYRLNRDGNYWQYSSSSPGSPPNPAFSQYVPVPGGTTEGEFTYTPDASSIGADGTVKLTVTGRVRDTDRRLRVTLRRRSFLDYLYFTDYETKDPAAYVKPPDPFTPAEAQVNCAKHYYEGRHSSCTRIFFISQDEINGPLHSNDAINLSGSPDFNGDTTTSWNDPAGVRWLGLAGSPAEDPDFANPGDPAYTAPLTMPPTNSALKTEALTGGGCVYTGPTQITLNSNGTMNVLNPWNGPQPSPKVAAVGACGVGNGRPMPSNGVIYVQNVPSSPTGCPGIGNPPYPNIAGMSVKVSGDINPYDCRHGDVFVSGTLRGQLTIAAEHDIQVVNHLRYQNGLNGTDLLGLIANNYVKIFHPVDDDGDNLNRKSGSPGGGSTFQNPDVYAAMLSLQHSFIVPRYQDGNPLGELNVRGAIAQRYRGPVGTFSGSTINSGYEKDYVYDTRLRYLSPPHFLDPVQAAWQVVTWSEVPST
jgi:hypothetical protein